MSLGPSEYTFGSFDWEAAGECSEYIDKALALIFDKGTVVICRTAETARPRTAWLAAPAAWSQIEFEAKRAAALRVAELIIDPETSL